MQQLIGFGSIVSVASLLCFTTPVLAKNGACSATRIEQALASTGLDGDATANVRWRVDEDCRRNLNVEVEDLAVGDYDLLVGGVLRAVIAVRPALGGTQGEVEFEGPDDNTGALPLDFDPLDSAIEIRGSSGLYFADVFDGASGPVATATRTTTPTPSQRGTRVATAVRTATRTRTKTPTALRTRTSSSIAATRTPGAVAPTRTASPGVATGGGATVRVTCEKRAGRSRVSVDGFALASGSYRAQAISAGNQAVSGARAAVGGQVELDFDSAANDIAAGATRISAAFVQGTPPQVTGRILNSVGAVVAQASAFCRTQ